jgi:hypothetical protein
MKRDSHCPRCGSSALERVPPGPVCEKRGPGEDRRKPLPYPGSNPPLSDAVAGGNYERDMVNPDYDRLVLLSAIVESSDDAILSKSLDGRHHHKLEQERGTAVWLCGKGSYRATDHHSHSAGPSGGRTGDHLPVKARRARGSLRHGSQTQRRQPDRHFADHFPGAGCQR